MNGLTVDGKAWLAPNLQNTVTGTLDGNNGEINGKVRSAGLLDGRLWFHGNVSVAGQHFAGDANVQFIFGGLSYAKATDILGFSGDPSVEWGLFGNTSTVSGPSGPTAFDRVLVFGNLAFSSATSLSLGFNGLGSTVDWSDAFWSTNRSWTIWEVTGNTTGFGNLTLGTADWLDASGDFLSSPRRARSHCWRWPGSWAGGGGEDSAPDVSLRRRVGRSRPNPGRWRSPTRKTEKPLGSHRPPRGFSQMGDTGIRTSEENQLERRRILDLLWLPLWHPPPARHRMRF
jgi:hypothetical protein